MTFPPVLHNKKYFAFFKKSFTPQKKQNKNKCLLWDCATVWRLVLCLTSDLLCFTISTADISLCFFDYSCCSIWLAACVSVILCRLWALQVRASAGCFFFPLYTSPPTPPPPNSFCLARARWQGMFSQMGLEIWIKWTSNYLDAQSLDDTPLAGSSRGCTKQQQQRQQQQQLLSSNSCSWTGKPGIWNPV